MPRQNLYTVLCTVLGCVLLGASAASVQPPHTPPVTHGISAGDVTSTSAVIWARTDRNANMHVFLHGDTPPALHTTPVRAAHDYAGKILLTHLRPNTAYRYTVWFTDTPHPHTERPPGVHGTFRTAPLPSSPQAVTFAWSGDLAGQNVCRDATEGFATLRAVNALALDFFIGLGDIIYADNTCTATGLYGNAQVPGDFGPAVTLEDFWAHWKYTRADAGFQRLTARTAYYAVWDDHEVINDFGPLTDHSQTSPYTGEPLLPNGLAAFLDYNPIPQPALTPKRLYRNIPWGRHLELFLLDTRQYRDANVLADDATFPKTMLGREQLVWLKTRLKASTATWKLIVTSVPMSIPTGFPPENGRDGWANADQDTGFEHELLDILHFLNDEHIANTVWITTDVHFATGFRYHPFPASPQFTVSASRTRYTRRGCLPSGRRASTPSPPLPTPKPSSTSASARSTPAASSPLPL